MNSLVVLLSVVALASAVPSGLLHGNALTYSAGLIATAPAAVSSQSRLDIKSSPSVIATSYSAPAAIAAPLAYSAPVAYSAPAPVAYTSGSAVSSQSRLDINSSPAVVATSYSAPAAIAAPVAYSAPAAIAAPGVYSAPAAIAAPVAYSVPKAVAFNSGSAVSSQSRLDIKSSPAVVATSYSAPAAIAAPFAYSAPAAIAAPIAYSTPAVASYSSGSAVSSQSRFDIKSTPAITSTYLSAPQIYSAPIATAVAPAIVKTAFAEPTYAKTAFAAPAYLKAGFATSGIAVPALATAFAAPGVIKTAAVVPAAIGAPAVPLDTPEVIAARSAHFEAKALAEGHLIHKRSVFAAPLYSHSIATPVVSTYAAAPIYSSPLTYSTAFHTPIVTKAYGIHPW